MSTDSGAGKEPIQLGIRPNLAQFLLLIVINVFVGGMVGLERTVVPLIGRNEFHISSTSVITSFIVSFGVTKAIVDLIAGQMADRWGRKPILVLGWIVGLPVPFLIIHAPDWSWIIAANVLLGANQGFAWSMTVLRWLISAAIMNGIAALHREMGHSAPKWVSPRTEAV